MASAKKETFGGQGDDIVHALWRHRDKHEQGIRSGSCGWITSFLEILSRKTVNFCRTGQEIGAVPAITQVIAGWKGIDLVFVTFMLLKVEAAVIGGFCFARRSFSGDGSHL